MQSCNDKNDLEAIASRVEAIASGVYTIKTGIPMRYLGCTPIEHYRLGRSFATMVDQGSKYSSPGSMIPPVAIPSSSHHTQKDPEMFKNDSLKSWKQSSTACLVFGS